MDHSRVRRVDLGGYEQPEIVMTKDEVLKLAKNYFMDANHLTEHQIYLFATACYTAGLERAAEICEDVHDWTDIARLNIMRDCAAAIREARHD